LQALDEPGVHGSPSTAVTQSGDEASAAAAVLEELFETLDVEAPMQLGEAGDCTPSVHLQRSQAHVNVEPLG
jgi:hypothetical protein